MTACEVSDSERVASACSAICACTEAPLPAVQDRCIVECTADAPGDLSDECLACISGNESCAILERDCEPICNPPEPVFADAPP